VPQLHAAAEPLPVISQWTQLPAREDARLLDLSASALQTYESCPLKYKLRYDWRLPEDASAAPQFGNAVHLALKAYFDGVRAGRPPDQETVIACFADEFAKASIPEQYQRELYEQKGREQLSAFLQSDLAKPAGEVLETERRFTIEIGAARVRGRLDRLDSLGGGKVSVVDYKTGKLKTQDDADESLQLSIYALAAKSFGYDPASLVFLNLENGTAVESQRTEKQLRTAEAVVTSIAQKIAEGEFDPKPGTYCSWCSYNTISPTQEEPLPKPVAERAVGVS
jgi:RecB family exonuclease